MNTINAENFDAIEMRAGTIKRVEPFPEAHKPSYRIWVDLGEDLGVKKSSAPVTELYDPDDLVGMQVVCIANTSGPAGPAGPEVLVTGFHREDGTVCLTHPESEVKNGERLA